MKNLLLLAIAVVMSTSIFAQCNDLFISEYVHGVGNNRAIEIYNPTTSAIDLSGYKLVRYSNGGTTPAAVGLSNTLQPAECWVAVMDKRDPNGTGLDTAIDVALEALADTFLCPVYSVNKMMYFNGNDAVTLEKNDGTYLDMVGKIGEDPGVAWTTDADNGFTSAGDGHWVTKRTTLVRKYNIKQGVTTIPPYFNATVEWDTLPNMTFDHLKWHQNTCQPTSINTPKENDCFFYPNPSTSGFFIVKGTEIIKSVEVISIVGKIVISQENPVARGDMKITTDNLKAGVYMVNVLFKDNTSTTKKIIIK